MPAYASLRKLDTNTFVSGSMVSTKINNVQYGRDLLLVLSGILTTGITPTTNYDAPWSLISSLDLNGTSGISGNANQNGSIHRLAGIDLFALNAFETGQWPYVRRHGSSNSTPYTFDGMLVLPFTSFPTESLNLLPHPAFGSMQLDVVWGTLASLGTNIGSGFTTTPTLTIYEMARLNPAIPPPGAAAMMKTVTRSNVSLTASSTDGNVIDIKTGLPIQSALIRVVDNSIRSDTFVTGVSVVENDVTFHVGPNMPWNTMQMYNKYRGPRGNGQGYPMVEQADNNTANRIGLGVTNRATMMGYVYLDFVDLEGQPILVPGAADTFKILLYTTTSAGGTPAAYAVLRQKIG